MSLPIHNYHGLETRAGEYPWHEEEKPYVVDSAQFSVQMEELARGGYQTFTSGALKAWNDGQGPAKPVMITFDDGMTSHGEIAAPILQKKGFKAVFFIPVALVGQKGHMGWDELKILHRHGFEIGSHGLRHIALTGLPETELKEEFEKSKKILEDKLGVPVKSFSIPRGFYNDTMRHLARLAGYEYLFTSSFDINKKGCDLFELKRMVVKKTTTSKQFSNMLQGNLGFRRAWEKMKEQVRGTVPPAFYDSLAAAKRKVRGC
jgi:peptidoglycan/xylan/chitin deacetylase (PgdA/CDA1 family)